MADYTPEELLIGGHVVDPPGGGQLIRLVVGVDMTEQGVGLWLRRHAFAPQRPARRTYEQQPAAVRAWLDEDNPAIEPRARAEVRRRDARSECTPGCLEPASDRSKCEVAAVLAHATTVYARMIHGLQDLGEMRTAACHGRVCG
ncbi:helix-turn-helix domain-containing protein [Lentzea xinjiangensis]|uniref:helix-turn-helix domain-containing protein n=1 Tax=Lentzea xinjiangensis TaxID=402600 RepID=UPI000A3DB4E1|nr:winged helix-turn-helix domain-containing protein [Lentzea xinjiangensis]